MDKAEGSNNIFKSMRYAYIHSINDPINAHDLRIDRRVLKNLIKSALVSHRSQLLTTKLIDSTTDEICETVNDFFLKLHLE